MEQEAIRIRRVSRLKLPDAWVAAMALIERLPLVTADRGDLRLGDLPLVLYQP